MITLILEDRCTACHACVRVCPTNVFAADPGQLPVLARQTDCQTCFLCELYCPADALYVAPDCERVEPIESDAVLASGQVGTYRRDSGWDEWSGDPHHANEHWRMDAIFAHARTLARQD